MKTTSAPRALPPSVALRCERRREEILAMAITLFARDGFADLDLQLLADAVGVGKGTLYRHFGNKEKLFLAAVDRVMRDLQRHIDTRIEGVEDPFDRICRAIHAYLEHFDAHPEAVEMLIQERAQFKDRKRPTYFEYREASVGRWRDLYRELIAQGRIRDISPERLTDVVGNLLYGTMFVNYIAKRHRPPAEMAEDILDIVFHGILTEPERQRGRKDASRPR